MHTHASRKSRDDEDDDDNVLKDGHVYRVPLALMDEQQKAVAQHFRRAPVVDAFGQPAGQRQGYVFANDGGVRDSSGDDARRSAWEERERKMSNGWRDTTATWFAPDNTTPPVNPPTPNLSPRPAISVNDSLRGQAHKAYKDRCQRLQD